MVRRKIPSVGDTGLIKGGGLVQSLKFDLIQVLKVDIHRLVEKIVDKVVDKCSKYAIGTILYHNAPRLSIKNSQ